MNIRIAINIDTSKLILKSEIENIIKLIMSQSQVQFPSNISLNNIVKHFHKNIVIVFIYHSKYITHK